jgi:hypothetical protein
VRLDRHGVILPATSPRTKKALGVFNRHGRAGGGEAHLMNGIWYDSRNPQLVVR